jgi:hypothetical protein
MMEITGLGPGGSEDGDGWREPRERVEGFNKLRHDLEDPPRILVDAL